MFSSLHLPLIIIIPNISFLVVFIIGSRDIRCSKGCNHHHHHRHHHHLVHLCRRTSSSHASSSSHHYNTATPYQNQQKNNPEPNTTTTTSTGGTVNAQEAKKFAKLAGEWWAPNGAFKALHQLNPTRCAFIRSSLCDNYSLDAAAPAPLTGLRVLDVGCGGGILSEALARMGASVHGIDVNSEGIAAAAAHAALDPSLTAAANTLRYSTSTLESIAASGEQYDAVIASEVIEHVASVPLFCAALVQATAPGGAVILSTLNRTMKSFALAIVAAEHLLHWAPPGTHEWNKFLTPEECVLAMEEAAVGDGSGGVAVQQVAGMIFDPLQWEWRLGRDVGVNYIAYFRKNEQKK